MISLVINLFGLTYVLPQVALYHKKKMNDFNDFEGFPNEVSDPRQIA